MILRAETRDESRRASATHSVSISAIRANTNDGDRNAAPRPWIEQSATQEQRQRQRDRRDRQARHHRLGHASQHHPPSRAGEVVDRDEQRRRRDTRIAGRGCRAAAPPRSARGRGASRRSLSARPSPSTSWRGVAIGSSRTAFLAQRHDEVHDQPALFRAYLDGVSTASGLSPW